jgi:hypothetical protein
MLKKHILPLHSHISNFNSIFCSSVTPVHLWHTHTINQFFCLWKNLSPLSYFRIRGRGRASIHSLLFGEWFVPLCWGDNSNLDFRALLLSPWLPADVATLLTSSLIEKAFPLNARAAWPIPCEIFSVRVLQCESAEAQDHCVLEGRRHRCSIAVVPVIFFRRAC